MKEITLSSPSQKTGRHSRSPQCPVNAADATHVEENGKMRIGIAKDMPQFLVDANAAIQMGHIEQAKSLVNDQAIQQVSQILENDPSRTDIMFMLATILNWTGQKRQAYTWYERCTQIKPNALAYYEMAMLCGSRGRSSECIEYLNKAIETDPDIPVIWVNLGIKLIERKQITEGFGLLRKAIQKEPDNPVFYSVYLFCLNHLPEMDPQMVFKLHQHWGKLHAPISKAKTSHDNEPVPDRKLRIGYISPDFRKHSVMYFFEPLLDGHDRNLVEVYGYGNVGSPDQTTERLKGKFDHYRNICGVDDRTVAQRIEQDRIDILVELAGHTKNNSLLVLAHKPAPIQVTYLGYGETTGMEAIDYILTDIQSVPPECQKYYSEELMYLPGGYYCYRPPENDVAVTPPPSIENGYITFGSLAPHRRFNLELLKVWAEILNRIPSARMRLGFAGGMDEGVRNHYLSEFEQSGISRERVNISGPKPYTEYLKEYSKMDILLDTFPENGGTYTCESLWMGVPVITLAGQRQIHRAGLSTLSRVGQEQFAATTPAEYVTKAVALANDPKSLVELRGSMRSQITTSPLCNVKQYTHEVESAYREMWHRWCRKHGVSVPS